MGQPPLLVRQTCERELASGAGALDVIGLQGKASALRTAVPVVKMLTISSA